MNELFNIDDLLSSPKGSYLGQGIHTNVTVKSISRKDTPNKNKFVEILFEKDGATIAKPLWEPKGAYPNEKENETTEDAIAREKRENLTHIAKILNIFLTPEQKTVFPNLDYNNFIDKAIAVVTPLLPNKKVNLKVIYNSDGVYTELGKYPDYVELFEEGQEPKIAFTPYEITHRTTPKAKSATKKNTMEDLLGDSPV